MKCEHIRRVSANTPWLVEVRGVEPRSSEMLVPASPSASDRDCRAIGPCRQAIRCRIRKCLSPPVPEPRREPPPLRRPDPARGEPTGRTDCLVRQPVRSCLRHVFVSRLFNEDSGDLGSLPAPRSSESKPCHPHVGALVRRCAKGTTPLPTWILPSLDPVDLVAQGAEDLDLDKVLGSARGTLHGDQVVEARHQHLHTAHLVAGGIVGERLEAR
jgi:hypothetical protein